MAGRGKITTDGYFYQLYSLLYGVLCLREDDRLSNYKIGREIEDYDALDDVVLEAEFSNGKRVTYCLQAKQSASSKIIGIQDLKEDKNLNVLKYFKSFLKITKPALKPIVPLGELSEMIIWCPYDIHEKVRDICDQYNPIDNDLFKPLNKEFNYERYRIVNYNEFTNLLEQAHPLAILADKFSTVIRKNDEWSSKRAAKSCYRVMAKEVINCNGHNSSFRVEFLDGEKTLHPDTLLFRKLFEQALEKSRRKNETYTLKTLNDFLKGNPFQLNVDTDFTTGNNESPSWNVKEYVPVEQDLKDFFERFVFYAKVPKVADMEKLLRKRFNHDFDQLKDFMDKCSYKVMLTKAQIKDIYCLMQMQRDSKEHVEPKLNFEEKGLIGLQERLSETTWKFLYVLALQDYDCSVARVFSVLSNDVEVAKRFVLLPDWASCWNETKILLSILAHNKRLAEQGLKYIVFLCDSVERYIEEISKNFSSADVKVILVGKQPFSNTKWSTYSDNFDVRLLSERVKYEILNKEISFFGNPAVKVEMLIPKDDLFETTDYKLVLALLRNQETALIGDELKANPYFINRSIKQKASESKIDILDKTGPATIIISDQTGMGKTTELLHLALEFREKYKDFFTVYMSSLQVVENFLKNGDKMGKTVDIIGDLLKNRSELARLLIEKMMEMKKLVLLIDAYDEISNDYQEKFNAIIESICKVGVAKICITTKPHFETALSKILPKPVVCVLEKFSVDHQMSYLKKFWNLEDSTSLEAQKAANQNARAVIEKFSKILRDESLLGIPIQTHMIAEIYKDTINTPNFTVIEPFEIGALVDKFIDIMMLRYLVDSGYKENLRSFDNERQSTKSSSTESHIKLARRTFLRVHDDATKDLFEKCTVYRLVQLMPTVGFVHEIYRDFFLSQYMLTYQTERETFKKYMKKNFCKDRINIATKFLDFHIGQINPETQLKRLEEDKISSETESTNTVKLPSKFIRVHKEKQMELYWYFKNHCTSDEIFTLIRNSFNASVFNVFEMLYDSLPEEIKCKVKFRFGANEQKSFINLKLMGENQVLQLLDILRKKHPETFSEFLKDFQFDEEDFLEVACRKPFLKVIEWFEKLDESSISVERRVELLSYIQHRLPGYLKLVVQHNNSQLLDSVIEWIEKKVSKSTVCQILREHNIMKVFVENIAEEGATKKLLEERRIAMILSIRNFFLWAYDCAVLDLDGECLAKVRNETIKQQFLSLYKLT
ncbi:uncharacterized protein LOC129726423 [Wyeomyia smithii]|uniref:uncharacterized protein LOC129726423 n=1 Tax=Wyeomyia smithii TaxID=174621 RepID=UPI0024680E5C|nr:uncharacterized protein LOC129726423 [Wyeomyia smithii]XP_055539060.1 uncharacterized protein LOC129726423 [Wyeomyia smithii]